MDIIKDLGGRPTDYKPEYAKMLLDHLSQGYSIGSFGGDIGVVRSTIYNWIEKHEDFKQAKQQGYANGLKFFEKIIFACALGQKINNGTPNVTAVIFILKTRFHKFYGEVQKMMVENKNIDVGLNYEEQINMLNLYKQILEEKCES